MTRKHLLFILALLCSQVSFAQFIGFETEIPKEFTTPIREKSPCPPGIIKKGSKAWNGISVPVPNSIFLWISL